MYPAVGAIVAREPHVALVVLGTTGIDRVKHGATFLAIVGMKIRKKTTAQGLRNGVAR